MATNIHSGHRQHWELQGVIEKGVSLAEWGAQASVSPPAADSKTHPALSAALGLAQLLYAGLGDFSQDNKLRRAGNPQELLSSSMVLLPLRATHCLQVCSLTPDIPKRGPRG